jgi:hypothetical protein
VLLHILEATNGFYLVVTVAIQGRHLSSFSSNCSADYCNRRLLDGLEDFGQWQMPDGCSASLQADFPAAKDTIKRINVMENDLKCHVALAHDAEWMKSGTDQVLMSLVDEDMKIAARERIPIEAVI